MVWPGLCVGEVVLLFGLFGVDVIVTNRQLQEQQQIPTG